MDPSHCSDNKFQAPISAKEMFKISHEISNDFCPAAPVKNDKTSAKDKLSAKELLKVSQNIGLYFAPKILPDISKLTLLAIDPRHLYVYWNLAENQPNSLLQSMHKDKLVLRIYSQLKNDKKATNSKPFIEIPIQNIRHQKTINVPLAHKQTLYSACIGNPSPTDSFTSLVKSNELDVSKGNMPFAADSSVATEDTEENNEPFEAIALPHFSSPTSTYYTSSNHSGLGKTTHDK